jgi:hypothetical protein
MQPMKMTVLALALVACNRPVHVEGDVFVVTKGRQNIKLALVDVALLPEVTAKQLAQKATADAQVALRAARGRTKQAEEAARSQDGKVASASADREVAQQERLRAIGTPTSEKAEGRYQEALGAWERELKAHSSLLEKQKRALLEEMSVLECGFFRGRLIGEAVARAKSDADGKFSFDVVGGRYGLVAFSSRLVGDKTEEYCWLNWLAVPPAGRLMLSNDNMLDSACADCLIDVAQIGAASSTPG